MRTQFFHMALVAVSVAMLGGCGTIDEIFRSDNDDVVIINAADAPVPGNLTARPAGAPPVVQATPAPGQPYAGNFNPDNLMSVYNQISRGGVQMYDPSNPAAYASLSNTGGIPAPQDSRVTIFPVEGDYYDGMSMGGGYTGGSSIGGGYVPSSVAPYMPGNQQITFAHGSNRLSPSDEQRLEQVAEQAKFSPVDRISIEGHASTRANTGDPVSDRIVNLKQSMDRTYAVSRSLIRKGVPAEKIRAVSWGDTRNPSGMPEDQTRRVDIYTGGP